MCVAHETVVWHGWAHVYGQCACAALRPQAATARRRYVRLGAQFATARHRLAVLGLGRMT